MIDYESLYRRLETTPMAPAAPALRQRLARVWERTCHGDLDGWMNALGRLPALAPENVRLASPCVGVGGADSVGTEQRQTIADALQALHPWRKGPFCLHGVRVDAEWRSDLKWARVEPALAPLRGRRVLDVGCGNGYYGWRMLGAGAAVVLGIDPSLRFVCQYEAVRRLLGDLPNYVLPLALEDLPPSVAGFDTVLSMGVFYHRRSPFDHLLRLKQTLRPGGELVLETLVIDGGEGQVLVPADRYARMRNVWFLPSVPTLEAWVRRSGFRRVRTVDVTPTGTAEQRRTEWMRFHSLADFLDPEQPQRTVEGLPAPVRAIILAEV